MVCSDGNVRKAEEVLNLQIVLIWIIQTFENRKLTSLSCPALNVYMHANSSERLLCITHLEKKAAAILGNPRLGSSGSALKIYRHKGSLHNLFKETHIINISSVSYIS